MIGNNNLKAKEEIAKKLQTNNQLVNLFSNLKQIKN